MAKWACAALFLVNLIALSTQQPVFHEDVYTAIIREENEETPVQVLKVEASGDNLWYSLQDTASHYFSINPRTGEIELIKPLDRDEKAVYHIVAMATDADGYGASGFADVIIGLYDINDRAPEFMHEPYSFTVNEDAAPVTVIGSMTATDLDDPNKPDHVSISYSITKNIQHNDTNVFEIDPMNGDIRLAYNDQTSFIRGESFEIEVQAEDMGGLKSTSTATITVTGPPRFAQQLYFAELEKDMELDHVVIVVSAMDDIMSSELEFSIVGGNEDSAFSIDNGTEANTADIKLQTDLMSVTSTNNTFNLTLQVSNSRYTSQATLFMKVMDTNLYAPVFDPPSYAVSWLENTTVGTVLETVTATDDDDENSPNGQFQ
ncbi:cadherin-8-like [Ptychodera flava]|uniref:cadherin-8-like n=1 Tax=Ptychodera flava TaxID=63121 RepID=UPI00396A2AED